MRNVIWSMAVSFLGSVLVGATMAYASGTLLPPPPPPKSKEIKCKVNPDTSECVKKEEK